VLLFWGVVTGLMARTCKRFAVGQYMKAKRDVALQLAKEKASLTSAVRTKQQQVRRLILKVNFIYSTIFTTYTLCYSFLTTEDVYYYKSTYICNFIMSYIDYWRTIILRMQFSSQFKANKLCEKSKRLLAICHGENVQSNRVRYDVRFPVVCFLMHYLLG
jgi:hypothetical protein